MSICVKIKQTFNLCQLNSFNKFIPNQTNGDLVAGWLIISSVGLVFHWKFTEKDKLNASPTFILWLN